MNIREAIKIAQDREATEVVLEDLERALETGTFLHWSEEVNKRLNMKPVNTWVCTDTLVGLFVVFFDGEPVGMASQPYRKSDMLYEWFAPADALRVREFIRQVADMDEALQVPLVSLDDDIPESWLKRGGRDELCKARATVE